MVTQSNILDSTGRPYTRSQFRTSTQNIEQLRRQIRKEIKAKYDAAQTVTGNELHWIQSDNLDPHTVSSLAVRRKIRSRSRYEIIFN